MSTPEDQQRPAGATPAPADPEVSAAAPDLDDPFELYDDPSGEPLRPRGALAEAAAQADAAARAEPAAGTPSRKGPLGAIALTLSGGGYRAAGFHLGVMSFLDRMGLLPDVAALSTVSGGTIAGMGWAASVVKGEKFADFLARITGWMSRTNVISQALQLLEREARGSSGVTPSLIRAAASIYSRDDFLGQRRMDELFAPGALPLDEAIFNSTEFRSGVDFRFRRSHNPRAVIGNGNFPLPGAVAEHVRLADVVAASSCFPGGFEPILFPDHFAWPAAMPLADVKAALPDQFAGGVALMDGGVYDNQGVDAVVLAYRRAAEKPLLLICDTSAPPNDKIYTFPATGGRGRLTMAWLYRLGWVTFVLSLLSAILLAEAGWNHAIERGDLRGFVLLYVVPLLFTAGVAVGLVWLNARMKQVGQLLRQDVLIDNAWNDLKQLTVKEMITMVSLRVGSIVALTSSVFMKRIRSLILNAVYADPGYEHKRIPNFIYSLTLNQPALWTKAPWLKPTAALSGRAATISQMATTLWFTPGQNQLQTLLDIGAATTCFTLLRHIVETSPAEPAAGTPLGDLYQRLRGEWAKINV